MSSGLEAIVIKVASMGLKVSMLGKTIGELNPVFERLNTQMDLHICGEGGEYETLTLDCPLFRFRIVPDEVETVVVDECDMAPVAYLRIRRWHLEQKADFTPLVTTTTPPTRVTLPLEELQTIGESVAQAAIGDALDALRKRIVANRQEAVLTRIQKLSASAERLYPAQTTANSSPETSVSISLAEGQIRVFGLTADATRINEQPCAALARAGVTFGTIAEEVRLLMTKARICVELFGMKMADICYCWLNLSDMREFQAVNAEYCKHFGLDPPSRACVQTRFYDDHRVELDYMGSTASRTVLHVQSISRWAPTCIGPYSQGSMVSYTTSKVLHLAGQIGQDPPTMSLVEGGGEAQALAAIAHIDSVLAVMCPASQGSVLVWNVFVSEALSPRDQRIVLDTIKCKAKERAASFGGTADVVGLLVVPCLPRQAAVEIQVVAAADPREEIETYAGATNRGVVVGTRHTVESGAFIYQLTTEAQTERDLARDIECMMASIAKAAAKDGSSTNVSALRLYTSVPQCRRDAMVKVVNQCGKGQAATAVSVMPITAVTCAGKATSVLQAGCF